MVKGLALVSQQYNPIWRVDWKIRTPKAEQSRIIADLLRAMSRGEVTPLVDAVLPLAEFQTAIERAEGQGRSGKVLLGN